MAQQSNIDEYKVRVIESCPPLSAKVKESFFEWLSDGHAKKYSPVVYLSCIDEVSVYLIHRKISLIDLWELTKSDLFKSIYIKAISDNLFKVTNKKIYNIFVQVGKDFLKFLKRKPAVLKTSPVVFRPINQTGFHFTIKEAVIHALKTAPHGMTVGQIYNKIIVDGLYSFGAQNPQNVVLVEIERACVKSNYTLRASKDCFRYEINQKGEKVYFLLPSISADKITQQNNISTHVKIASQIQTISNSELDDIIDLEEGKTGIREILYAHFVTLHGYSNIFILWSAVQNSLSMFLNDNAINSADDLGYFLGRAFKNELVLSLPHIWKNLPEYPLTPKGLVINLVRQHGGIVTRSEIDVFFSQIKLPTLHNSFLLDKGQILFCDKAKFILTETVNPTTERCSLISKALDTLFSCENTPFIVLRDISSSWLSQLPELPNGLQWTPLLLQELLRICPDIGYRIISSNLKGQVLDTLGASIVSSKSDIKTFADLVHQFCFEKYKKLLFKLSAEELRLVLREAGMIDGNELIFNMHKALKDHRFAFSDENRTVMILER